MNEPLDPGLMTRDLHPCRCIPWASVMVPLPMQEMQLQSLGPEDPLEKEMATHSSILAWEVPWTEEPGGRQCTGSQKRWT